MGGPVNVVELGRELRNSVSLHFFLWEVLWVVWHNVDIIYLPHPKGRGTYCFWCGSRRCRRARCSFSALHLPNQLVDFVQTCTDTLLGERKEIIRFWWPNSHFQGHTGTFKFPNFDHKWLSAPYLLNQMTDSSQTSHIVTLGWFQDLFRFWWPWLNFQSHHTIKTVKMSLVCTLSPQPIGGFWPNLHRNTTETLERNDSVLVTLTWFSRTPHYKHCENEPSLHSISWTNWWVGGHSFHQKTQFPSSLNLHSRIRSTLKPHTVYDKL